MLVLVIMILQPSLLPGFLQFVVEQPTDRGIFLFLFDLFNFERNAEALRKISFRDGKVSSRCHTDVEVLLKPEERRETTEPAFQSIFTASLSFRFF